ncbi:acyl-CoA synthetase [Rhodobacteraceae bacterium 2CG4]|uniref:Acyl-CoA synthetase n=1 Tax=Halovulum marinum TaxID=2662447 RepID=A0A6L5Z4S9_9RHOB|nr:acyl-CoA synthetase [Halovulum marinum]MSU91105.1 acyl-CoA synthetase [Halovulum marinum]
MAKVATLDDKIAIEQEMPFEQRMTARSLYEMLSRTAERFPDRPALTFQIKAGPRDKAETLTWSALRASVTRAANLFRRIGIGDGDVIAYVLPNCNETAVTLLAGATAGIVNPINPLLEAEQIAAILRETGARAVVTLAPFPKTEVNDKVSRAVAMAPEVKTVLEVDLAHYLSPPVRWLVPLLRPAAKRGHQANVMDLNLSLQGEADDRLSFDEPLDDRICAFFHTGGTTGMPKVAQHRASGILFNGWCGQSYMFTEHDVLMCPLPLFHVFAAYPVLMSCLVSGAQMVMPTPAGYRGDGVMDSFWKLIERYKVTFLITVPTAVSALMQRKIDADVSTLRLAVSGSAPMPLELFRRFEEATGVKILEGYGMTEATCLVSINPPDGQRKVGSVGLPFPYSEVRILSCDKDGGVLKECGVDEVGEICVANPGVIPGGTYTETDKNHGLFAHDTFLRTGDLGRIDADGYLWITGRAKDLIIRGGHNVDPAQIEEAMMTHPDVAFAGAIGQPDAHAGEVPAVYLEMREGVAPDLDALQAHAREHIGERAAHPKYIEVLGELPKTAVGKVFKPELRKMAIARVYGAALAEAGVGAGIDHVYEDKKLGLVAGLKRTDPAVTDADVAAVLGRFARPWAWID